MEWTITIATNRAKHTPRAYEKKVEAQFNRAITPLQALDSGRSIARDNAVRIEDELFRRPAVKVLIALRRLIKIHYRNVYRSSDLNLVI